MDVSSFAALLVTSIHLNQSANTDGWRSSNILARYVNLHIAHESVMDSQWQTVRTVGVNQIRWGCPLC